MQYIPCNSALFAQETQFLTQKALFVQRFPKKVATNLNIATKYHMLGLKIFVGVQTLQPMPFAQFLPPCNSIMLCLLLSLSLPQVYQNRNLSQRSRRSCDNHIIQTNGSLWTLPTYLPYISYVLLGKYLGTTDISSSSDGLLTKSQWNSDA